MNKKKYILLFAGIFVFAVVKNYYDDRENKKKVAYEMANKTESMISKVDSSFLEINKTLPKFIVDGKVRLDSIHRDGMSIYQRYTLFLSSVELSTLQDKSKRTTAINGVKKELLPGFCSMKMQSELISMGYSFKFVYSDEAGNSLYDIVADNKSCNKKYWINL